MQLIDLFPNAGELETAPVVTVAGGVLRVLSTKFKSRFAEAELQYNFLQVVRANFGRYESALAASEGWQWLVNEGLLCQHPEKKDGWLTLTRKGQEAAGAPDLQSWNAGRALPNEMLHEVLHGGCLSLFRQGMFDTAVFEAFKMLEVRIRDAAGLSAELIGTKLTARAFDPNSGPLSDPEAEGGERQALVNLMAGALGSYKNPQSHRHVGVDAQEAREMILLASHLIKIVDSRRRANASEGNRSPALRHAAGASSRPNCNAEGDPMNDTSNIKRHAEWFDFSLPLGEGHVPVRISREAMEDHFGADAFETLGHAYKHHAEQIHLRVAPLAGPTPAFTADKPLTVQSKDL